MAHSTDVLICGAGAAGLTLAIDLARRGVPFRLIEKMDAPFRGSRGKGIQPRSMEVFEDLGIVDRLAAIGTAYPPQRMVREGSAPDAPMRGAGGQPTRLFDLFRGPHWTLLAYEADPASVMHPRDGLHIHAAGRAGDIVDAAGQFRAAYGVAPGDQVLVRPDGYVGAVVAAGHEVELAAYLDAVGVRIGVISAT